jgi:hypothetical protein
VSWRRRAQSDQKEEKDGLRERDGSECRDLEEESARVGRAEKIGGADVDRAEESVIRTIGLHTDEEHVLTGAEEAAGTAEEQGAVPIACDRILEPAPIADEAAVQP